MIIYSNYEEKKEALLVGELKYKTNFKTEINYYKKNIYKILITKKKKSIEIRFIEKILPDTLINFFDEKYKLINVHTRTKNWNYRFYKLFIKKKNFENYIITISKNNLFFYKYYFNKIHLIIKEDLKIDLSKFRIYSTSGIAINLFNLLTNNTQKNILYKIKEYEDYYIRKSYFGGRNEIFGNPLKNDKILEFDFIGMYSQIMKDFFPIDKGEFIYKDFNLEIPGFYEIEYDSLDTNIPVLPYKYNEKLIFPNGKNMKNVFWHEEIIMFIKNGGIINKIISGYIYKKTFKILEIFSTRLDTLKQKNNTNREIKNLYKKITNSLYGRFGIQNSSSFLYIINDEKTFYEIEKFQSIIMFFKVNEYWFIETSEKIYLSCNVNLKKEINYLNVAIASIITAKARIKIYETIIELKKNNARILFCNTDNIIFSTKNHIEKTKLTFFNKVKWSAEITDAVFINLKTYSIKFKDKKEKSVINSELIKKKLFNELKYKFYNNSTKIVIKKISPKKRIFFQKYFLIVNNKREFSKSKKYSRPFNLINNMLI